MDFGYIFKILLRGKWLILTAVIVPAIAAFLYVNTLEKTYKSEALISTGILGTSGLNPEMERQYIQNDLIKMNFSTFVTKMQSESILRLLSYELLLHELTGTDEPFRKLNNEVASKIQKINIQRLLKLMKQRIDDFDGSMMEIGIEKDYRDVSEAFKYDVESIKDKLTVYRSGDTDYLGLSFESEDPYLSAYTVNQLCKIFLDANRYDLEKEMVEEFEFAEEQAIASRAKLDSLKNTLSVYKEKHSILDLEAEASELITQIASIEQAANLSRKDIPSLQEQLELIENLIQDSKGNKLNKQAIKIARNDDLVFIKDQIRKRQEEYILTKDPAIKAEITMLEDQRNELLDKYSKAEGEDLIASGDISDDLAKERLRTEIEYIDRKGSTDVLLGILGGYNARARALVKHITYISKFSNEISLAQDSYEAAKNKQTTTKTQLDKAYFPLKIRQEAHAATKPQSNHKALITAFSGVVGGSFAGMLLLMLAFLDTSLNNSHQFEKFTDLNLLGTLNELKEKNIDLKELFGAELNNKGLEIFKEAIRGLRYEVEKSAGTSFLFTSTKEQEGKTFVIIMLAHALTLKGRKVLIIDTNFKNNSLTRIFDEDSNKNKLTTRLIGEANLDSEFEAKNASGTGQFKLDNVDILGNRGGMSSPSEIFAGKEFRKLLADFENNYDYIFLEGPSLNKYADSKELTEYVDKVITVFSAESNISDSDRKSIKYLQNLNGKLMGAVLNKLDLINLN